MEIETNDLPQKTEEHESNYSFTFSVTAFTRRTWADTWEAALYFHAD
jgi:hypothetical protein